MRGGFGRGWLFCSSFSSLGEASFLVSIASDKSEGWFFSSVFASLLSSLRSAEAFCRDASFCFDKSSSCCFSSSIWRREFCSSSVAWVSCFWSFSISEISVEKNMRALGHPFLSLRAMILFREGKIERSSF